MNSKENKSSKSRFPRVLLFILSMAPFFVILGLMCMNIPVSFDENAEFIGWHQLWLNTKVGIFIIVAAIVVEFTIYQLFKGVCNRSSGEQSEVVELLEDKNYELMTFVTSIFLPLISFQYNQLSHWIVTIIIVGFIGYIFCASDGFYTNPTLALFRYRLYSVQLGNQREGNNYKNRTIIVLSQKHLKENDKIRCTQLLDKVYYATLQDNKK